MARIRSVHPGLLTDEAFMQLTLDCPLAVTLLIGLWMEADDAGAFEWKPLTLKARILPAAPVKLDDMLEALTRGKFVRRFEIGGKPFGVIRNFVKYQRPKTPSDVHPCTAESRAYAGFVDDKRPRADRGRPSRHDDEDLFEPKVGTISDIGGNGSEIGAQMEEEGEGEGGRSQESSSASRADASARRPEIDLSQAKPLPTRDRLEAEARTLMAELPVAVDVDFSPISALLDEPGVLRGDVIAGLTAAAHARGFRPVSWRQLPGWVRRAAKDRIGAAADLRQPRGPPGGRASRPSDLSVCLEIARGQRADAPENAGFGARAGPVIDGRAVSL